MGIHHHHDTREIFQTIAPGTSKTVQPSAVLIAANNDVYLRKLMEIAVCIDITKPCTNWLIDYTLAALRDIIYQKANLQIHANSLHSQLNDLQQL